MTGVSAKLEPNRVLDQERADILENIRSFASPPVPSKVPPGCGVRAIWRPRTEATVSLTSGAAVEILREEARGRYRPCSARATRHSLDASKPAVVPRAA